MRVVDLCKKAVALIFVVLIIFSEYNPVFIGYAGNDNSLMDYLVENSGRFASGEWNCPYWMLYKNDQLEGRVKEFLDKSNGDYIRHEGFDEVILLLGNAFDYKVPTEDEFLSDAKDRYKTLQRAIDKFTAEAGKRQADAEASDSADNIDVKAKLDEAMRQITNQAKIQRMFMNATDLYAAGKYGEARSELQKLVGLEPENALYHHWLGETLHTMGLYGEALTEHRKAVELEPENALCHGGFGLTLHEMGLYEEALEELQKAVELDPENVICRGSLGLTLYEMKRYDEAVEELQKAVELDTEKAVCQGSLGFTLYAIGLYDEAVVAIRKAVELEPENAAYRCALGFTLHTMGLFEEALTEHRKAIELEPGNVMYHYRLGETLYGMKRYDEAEAAMSKAVGLKPEDGRYREALDKILREIEENGN